VDHISDVSLLLAEISVALAVLGTAIAITFNLLRTRFELTSRFRVLRSFRRSSTYRDFSEHYSTKLRDAVPHWNRLYLALLIVVAFVPIAFFLSSRVTPALYPTPSFALIWFVSIFSIAVPLTWIEWRKIGKITLLGIRATEEDLKSVNREFVFFTDLPGFVLMALAAEGITVPFVESSYVTIGVVFLGLSGYGAAFFFSQTWDAYLDTYNALWKLSLAQHPQNKIEVEVKTNSDATISGHVSELGKVLVVSGKGGRTTELEWSSVEFVTVIERRERSLD
jgi:hypothetical protein